MSTGKRLTLFATLVCCAVAALVSLYISNDRQFVHLHSHTFVPSTVSDETQQKVAIIGDSWVYRSALRIALQRELDRVGNGLQVHNFGHPGAKSREIFLNLLRPSAERFSSAAVLADPHYRYVVIVAGVNDSAGHVGSDFYAHHMREIVRLLNARGVHVFIVELPEYGIAENNAFLSHPPRSVLSGLKKLVYRYLFDGGKMDVIHDYRTVLSVELKQAGVEGYTLIPFDVVATDYDSSLEYYSDPTHLNTAGNDRLGKQIADYLLIHHRSGK